MARDGYLILDSDLHMMEPDDLWARYLEGQHRANLPRFFGGQQRKLSESSEDKGNADAIMGMEVQGLAIPAHANATGATASSRELRRRSRARHPHFQVARGRGFDPESTLTAMDIEGVDVAVMYGTRGRQILMHDDLAPYYAAALARAYNNWASDYCRKRPDRLKFAAQVAMHSIPAAIDEARRCVRVMGAIASMTTGGILERHPRLRCAFLEGTAGWLYWWLWRLDDQWEKFGPGCEHQLSMLPSEYFKRQCYIALDVDEEPAVDVVEKMGADYFVVSTDYPHSDGAFPEAMEQFFSLPLRDEVRRKILWDNCARLYGIAKV